MRSPSLRFRLVGRASVLAGRPSEHGVCGDRPSGVAEEYHDGSRGFSARVQHSHRGRSACEKPNFVAQGARHLTYCTELSAATVSRRK